MKLRLDHYDKSIIHFLGNRGTSNTNEIAEELEISWSTTLKHLERLEKLGYVTSEKEEEKKYWNLNY